MAYHLQEWANNPNGALVGAIGLQGEGGIDAEGSTSLSCARVCCHPRFRTSMRTTFPLPIANHLDPRPTPGVYTTNAIQVGTLERSQGYDD